MKHLRATLALGALVLAAPADGQQRRPGMGRGVPTPQTIMRAYGIVGYAPLELDALNARLASLDEPYSPVGEDMVVVGGGLHGRRQRMMIGFEGNVLFSTDKAEVGDVRRAAFSAANGSLMIGFSVIQTSGLDVYPLIQLGGAGASLEVQERGAPAWNDVMADPGRSTILSTAMFYGAGGMGMDYAFRSGFFMGLRGTWAYTPPSDDWTADTGDVLGGPEIDLSGPSVRLLVGFGGRGARY